jgi:plastocyanin
MRSVLLASLLLFVAVAAQAVEIEDHNKLMDHGGGHLMDMGGGIVMGQNTDRIPDGCSGIAATKEITVHAGHKYAKKFPGRVYAFDVQEYQFEPCTKLTINFINEDNVRHQWMIHVLPKYMYPRGMFHLEVTGPGKISGTLILPPGEKTYLVHCDLAQHMEKGMKGQLKTGKGSGDLPSIPGVTPFVVQDSYADTSPNIELKDNSSAAASSPTAAAENGEALISGVTVIGLAIGLLITPFLMRKFKGMSVAEVFAYVVDLAKQLIGSILRLISWIIGLVSPQKKVLPDK